MASRRWWAAGAVLLLAGCGGAGGGSSGGSGSAGSEVTVTATTTVTVTAVPPSPSLPSSSSPSGARRPSVQAGVVPNVVGLNHQLAQDTMQAAGFYFLTEEDATGQGRALILDRNWVVVSQQPAGGTKATPDTKITLRSKKIGE